MDKSTKDKLVKAYHQFVEIASESMDVLKEQIDDKKPVVLHALDKAKATIHDLGELSREEAELVREFVLKDLYSAGRVLKEEGREIADWLRMDALYLEDRVLDRISHLGNQTAEELHHIEEMATEFGEWRTGEITGAGTLVCNACGQHIHFDKPGHIPPCPKCGDSHYHRETT